MPGSVIRKRNIATAATAAAIAAGAVALPTFAQTGGSTTTTPQSGTTTTPGTTTPATPQAPWAGNHAQGKEQFDQRQEAYRKALADELGISVDKLEAAEKAARETVFVDNLDEMVTNGRFTKDALTYGEGVGLQLLAWDHPQGAGLRDQIDRAGLHPVTAISTLHHKEQLALLRRGIVLAAALRDQRDVIHELGISDRRSKELWREIDELRMEK